MSYKIALNDCVIRRILTICFISSIHSAEFCAIFKSKVNVDRIDVRIFRFLSFLIGFFVRFDTNERLKDTTLVCVYTLFLDSCS